MWEILGYGIVGIIVAIILGAITFRLYYGHLVGGIGDLLLYREGRTVRLIKCKRNENEIESKVGSFAVPKDYEPDIIWVRGRPWRLYVAEKGFGSVFSLADAKLQKEVREDEDILRAIRDKGVIKQIVSGIMGLSSMSIFTMFLIFLVGLLLGIIIEPWVMP